MAKVSGKVKVADAITFLKKKAPKAWKEGKGKEVEIKGGFLPAGINNGIAQLNYVGFSTIQDGDNKGEYRFEVRGVNKKPLKFNDQPLTGKPVNLRVDLVPTKGGKEGGRTWTGKTVNDKAKQMQDILKLLRGDNLEDTDDYDDLTEIIDELNEEKPFFAYRTWAYEATKLRPNPRTNVDITGRVNDFEEEDDETVVIEEEDDEEEEEEEETEETEEEESEESEEAEEEESEEEEEEEEEADWKALGIKGDKGDKKARAALTEKAGELELDPEDYPTWKKLAAAILEKASEDDSGGEEEAEEEEEEETEEEESSEPTKGDVMRYKPPKARKPIDVEVVKVTAKTKKASVKSLDSGKLYKDVPFADLTSA